MTLVTYSQSCTPVQTEPPHPFLLLLLLSTTHLSFDARHFESEIFPATASILQTRGYGADTIGLHVLHCPPAPATWGSYPATIFPAFRLVVPPSYCERKPEDWRARGMPHGECVLTYTGSGRPDLLAAFVIDQLRRTRAHAILEEEDLARSGSEWPRLLWKQGGAEQVETSLARISRQHVFVDVAISRDFEASKGMDCVEWDTREREVPEGGAVRTWCGGTGDSAPLEGWIQQQLGGHGLAELGPDEFNRAFRREAGLLVVLLFLTDDWRWTACARAIHDVRVEAGAQELEWRVGAVDGRRYRPLFDRLGITDESFEVEGQCVFVVNCADRAVTSIRCSTVDRVSATEFIAISEEWQMKTDPAWENLAFRATLAVVKSNLADPSNIVTAKALGDESKVHSVAFPERERSIPVLLLVHAPWCGFSQLMRAIMVHVKNDLVEDGYSLERDVLLLERTVDDGPLPIGLEQMVEGYPTLLLLEQGTDKNVSRYEGHRSVAHVSAFARRQVVLSRASILAMRRKETPFRFIKNKSTP